MEHLVLIYRVKQLKSDARAKNDWKTELTDEKPCKMMSENKNDWKTELAAEKWWKIDNWDQKWLKNETYYLKTIEKWR